MTEEFSETFTTGSIPIRQGKPTGIEMIGTERTRMIIEVGWSSIEVSGHDLYMAALAILDYVAARAANPYTAPELFGVPPAWPFGVHDWKPDADIAKNLAFAGALVAASLDALT